MFRIGLSRQLQIAQKRLSFLVKASQTSQPSYKKSATTSINMGKKRKLDAVKEQDGFYCPACNQMALKWPVFSRHLQRCCPDLLGGKDQLCDESLEQAQSTGESIRESLKHALAEEEVLRRQCVCTCLPSLPSLSMHFAMPSHSFHVSMYQCMRDPDSACS